MSKVGTAYPLKIENCSSDDAYTLMSRGHHDLAEFMKAAEAYWHSIAGFEAPVHTWWRSVTDSTGEYRCMFHEAKPGARGAFPVTVTTQW